MAEATTRKNNFLSNYQFGFRRNSSASHALCDVHNNLFKNIDQISMNCCLSPNSTKAIDTADHQILV